MYGNSLSRILLGCFLAVVLTACGGGGGGGGGDTIIGGGTDTGTGTGGATGTGSLNLTISGQVDASGNPDNTLSGNEFATLSAEVVDNGNAADVIVIFTTTIGRLVPDSAQSTGGTATVQITGDGTAGAATVTATATLSGGLEVTDSIIVQMSSEAPSLNLVDSTGADVTSIELRAAETSTVTARVTDWDGTPVEGVGVNLALAFDGANSLTTDITSGATDANGELQFVITGTQEAGTGTLTASATFSEFALEDQFAANGLGVNTDQNRLTLDVIDVGSDGVLAGNEKVQVVARILEDGNAQNGIVVQFDTGGTGGTLAQTSATSANNGTDDGVAEVQLIGDATAGTATITATATLGNGIMVSDTQTIQTSSDGPTITLVARNAAGAALNTFGANQVLTLEATIVDFDGSALDANDAGTNVTFNVGTLGTLVNTSDVSEFAVCPVNGIQENTDCAFVVFTSNSTGAVGSFTASATINGIAITDDLQVTNTGINSGSPDQDSFTITRLDSNDNVIATTDTFGIEGDLFNNQIATVQVDLADFFNNPVPDGTLVEFRTELGDIGNSCETAGGSCSVTFTSSDPRTPIDSEVSFRNLTDDNCPSPLVIDEVVTISGSGIGLTDYRVDDVKRVTSDATPTTIFGTSTYNVTANGIECASAPCTAGAVVRITYDRLWLDELDDGTTAHVIANPGEATEPFLDVTNTPCLAGSREALEVMQGSINPSASTAVVGVGTQFERDLIAGDFIKVNSEVREVVSVNSDTALTVATAFTDTLNDVSPERMAAPGYLGGMGQPYGGRSSILAFALGEESFVDANGNDEYDFGERFFDLPEVFMDKNEDGVLGDFEGDSDTAGTLGPYSDGGLGGDPAGAARDKSSPFCYGPQTIVGDPAGPGSSTEQDTYCYQDGGEEDFFIDLDGDGIMDLGNGIYNGSRCLTPMQDTGSGLEVVCTTDLVNISREVQILMAGTPAFIEFRTTSGGANGGGEIIQEVETTGGQAISNTIPDANTTNWNGIASAPVLVDITQQLGAQVNTTTLAVGARAVQLFSIPDVFTTTNAVWTLSFAVDQISGTGDIEVFVPGSPTALTFDGGTCGDMDETCTVSNFTVGATGALIVAAASAANFIEANINVFSLTGTSSGTSTDYRLRTGSVTSNDNTSVIAANGQINIGDQINSTTVFPGASERIGGTGVVPELSTTEQTLFVYFTDRHNGQLPDGSVVRIESNNSQGCTLASVNGVAVNSNDPGATTGSSHFGEVTIGSDVSTGTIIRLENGFGSGSVTATVTTPSGSATSNSITCELANQN